MTELTTLQTTAPFMRRLWVVILLTILLITFPVAVIILLTGDVYRKRDGAWQAIGKGPRYVYGGLLALWLVAVTLKAVMQPGGIKSEWERSADPTTTKTTQTASTPNSSVAAAPSPNTTADGSLPTCDNPEVIQTAREAIDESPAGITTGLKVVDAGKGQENLYDREAKVRRCATRVMLNSGSSIMTYQVLYGPSGNLMIQAQVGDRAVAQLQQDEIEAAQQAHKAEVKARASTPEQPSPEQPAAREEETAGR